MKTERESLNKYDLGVKCIKKIDLRTCYMQQTPNTPINELLLDNGNPNSLIINSPNYEISCLYYERGEKWISGRISKSAYGTWAVP